MFNESFFFIDHQARTPETGGKKLKFGINYFLRYVTRQQIRQFRSDQFKAKL